VQALEGRNGDARRAVEVGKAGDDELATGRRRRGSAQVGGCRRKAQTTRKPHPAPPSPHCVSLCDIVFRANDVWLSRRRQSKANPDGVNTEAAAERPMLISLSDHAIPRPPMSSSRRSGAATVTDVAQLAGVSVATVSRILNGTAQVTADKRAAVEEAIHKLQFRPNLSARSLRSGSTQTIGILTQEFESPYFIAGTKGVESGLEGSGYTPLVVPGHWNPQEELDRARLLMARRVDAIVILGGTLSDAQLLDMARQQPIAITGRQLQGPQLCAFHADQVAGGLLATRHLIELGHRAIAHIAGPRRPSGCDRTQGRFSGRAPRGQSVRRSAADRARRLHGAGR
jgi:transcriptional regulator with XRE-family HTH domain